MNELNNAVMTLILKEVHSGNITRCRNLGFTLDEINEFKSLTANDITQLSHSRIHILDFTVNHTSLISQFKQVKNQRKLDRQIDRAIVLNGSIELLTHFFGLSTQEISLKRKLSGAEACSGRCRQLTEAEDIAVWEMWQKNGIGNIDSHEALDSMMLISETLSTPGDLLPLTAIWSALKKWGAKEHGR